MYTLDAYVRIMMTQLPPDKWYVTVHFDNDSSVGI